MSTSPIIAGGMFMRIIPRMSYTLSPAGNGAFPNPGIVIPIARGIDVGPFTEAEWQLRVHAVSISTGGSLAIAWGFEGFTQEDPRPTSSPRPRRRAESRTPGNTASNPSPDPSVA